MPGSERIFLLSPANAAGKRAELLLRSRAAFPLAHRLRSGEAVTLAELFTFMSGLYFRGKLVYASAFAAASGGSAGVYVIVPGMGLRPPDSTVCLTEVGAMRRVRVDPREPSYTRPLLRDAARLAEVLPGAASVVLLGSVATSKYLDPLREAFGARVCFPRDFVGLGAMARGSLLLRCAAEGHELAYTAG